MSKSKMTASAVKRIQSATAKKGPVTKGSFTARAQRTVAKRTKI